MSPAIDCRVALLLADYVAIDAIGKINVVGGGVAICPLSPQGLTAPLHLLVTIDVARQHVGTEFPICIELRRLADDSVVDVPTDPTGRREALRIQQMVSPEATVIEGRPVQDQNLPARLQFAVAFATGLPLPPGQVYAFTVEVDSQRRPEWSYAFVVPARPSGPVFGGPAGPAGIPGIRT